MTRVDPYDVLGLGPTASNAEIESQYRQLLRRHHPDMHQGEGPQGIAQAEYATRLLNQAITQIRRERDAATTSASGGPGVGATGAQARAGDPSTGTDPHNRAHARARSTPPPTGAPGASHERPHEPNGSTGAPGTGAPTPGSAGPWWAGSAKTGSACPFCGLHLVDYASYEQHLHEAHRFRIEAHRRRGISISIGPGLADALRVLAMLVSAVALLWLSVHIQVNAIVGFLLWLGIVALFLPTMLLRPRRRRR